MKATAAPWIRIVFIGLVLFVALRLLRPSTEQPGSAQTSESTGQRQASTATAASDFIVSADTPVMPAIPSATRSLTEQPDSAQTSGSTGRQQAGTATAAPDFIVPAETPVRPAMPTATRGPFVTASPVLPWDGIYYGTPDPDIAQQIADAYADSSGSPVTIETFRSIGPEHAEALGIPLDQISYGDAIDMAIILSGSFPRQGHGSTTVTHAAYLLVVMDRRSGVYMEQTGSDLQALLQLLKP